MNHSEHKIPDIKTLKKAIPPHCFQPSILKSFSYLALDLAIVSLTFWVAIHFITPDNALWAWPLYWVLQGTFITGLWVIAHECGHHAFSKNKTLNNTVGLILHTLLLVPYFSWQISHASHHNNNVNIEHDETFVPTLEEESTAIDKVFALIPGLKTVTYLLFGWPMYLLFNVSAGKKYKQMGKKWINHFAPNSPIFQTKDRHLILLTDVCLVAFISGLIFWGHVTSWWQPVSLFILPYLICNGWLVTYTMLHHTDQKTKYYKGTTWNWLKGALGTVDRNYGIFDYLHHHIGSTHVCHHIFSFIPHYHAKEATRAIAPLLGPYYVKDNTSILKALWNADRKCKVAKKVSEDTYQY